MIERVVFLGDLCRGAQAHNVARIERLFSPVFVQLGVPTSIHVSEINRNICLNEWLGDWKQSLCDGHESLLKPIDLDKAAVVGFEIPADDLSYLDRNNVPWVNLSIHPIRFLDDLYFEVTTSFDGDINPMAASTGLIAFCVNELSTRYARTGESDAPPALAIFGQTPIDKSIYFDQSFKTLDCYLEQLDELAGRHSRVLFRPHPNATSPDVDRMICERYGATRHTEADVYKLFVTGRIATACAISSSVLEEVPYFGIKAEYLEARAKRFGRPVCYRSLLDHQEFWAQGLLRRTVPTVPEIISRAVPAGYLRQSIESWGYVTAEKIAYAQATEAARMSQEASVSAREAVEQARLAKEVAQALSNTVKTQITRANDQLQQSQALAQSLNVRAMQAEADLTEARRELARLQTRAGKIGGDAATQGGDVRMAIEMAEHEVETKRQLIEAFSAIKDVLVQADAYQAEQDRRTVALQEVVLAGLRQASAEGLGVEVMRERVGSLVNSTLQGFEMLAQPMVDLREALAQLRLGVEEFISEQSR